MILFVSDQNRKVHRRQSNLKERNKYVSFFLLLLLIVINTIIIKWKSILSKYFLPTYIREVSKLLNPRGMSNLITDDDNAFDNKKSMLFKPITEEYFKQWRAGPGIDVNKVCDIVALLFY